MTISDDIYSPANIARSRARAADVRAKIAAGTLGTEYSKYADDIDAGADERERKARSNA